MNTLEIEQYNFSVPGSYNEVTESQLQAIGRVFVNNRPESQLICIYRLIGLPTVPWRRSDLKKWWAVRKLSAKWLHTILFDKTMMGWIFDKAQLTAYPVQSFRVGLRKYYGPKDKILNINVGEITYGYEFFKQYSKSEDTACLDKLIALLYRPKNPFAFLKQWSNIYTGDKRMALNNYNWERRIERFKKLSPELKMSIFFQWAGAWEQFENLDVNKYMFPKAAQVAGGGTGKDDPFMWRKVMMRVAESGPFGNMEKVEMMNKDEFFLYLNKNIEEYLERKDRKK